MVTLISIVAILAIFLIMMALRAPLLLWAVIVMAVAAFYQSGVTFDGSLSPEPFQNPVNYWGWGPGVVLLLLAVGPLRKSFFTLPLLLIARRIMPGISDTEKEALEAGTVGWDAELFSGSPDWPRLLDIPPAKLTHDEKAFLDGPTEELCQRIDDWEVRKTNDLPDDIWKFIAGNGFFGMLISSDYGGLGFGADGQSQIIGKIASRSATAAITVMVPNSLGPGELLMKYGTAEQKNHYLPRLANGDEIPCFALTGPTSGSDAATMRDTGMVCQGDYNGETVLGVSVTWDKRYITLCPVATLLGLAFMMKDPDGLLGDVDDIGITLALIPTNHPGVIHGRRHFPAATAFQNGPTQGNEVFIPMDFIIGGKDRVGQGWRMLMDCLSVGRAISLPSTGTSAAKTMLRHTSAYVRIRKQFGLAIGKMEGVEEALTPMVRNAYQLEAARSLTARMVDQGEKPAVLSALLKYQATERMRQSVDCAMDIHGGRAICEGPANYVLPVYQVVPVGITVEGANILTRSLITFTQGALRGHPWLYKEIEAIQSEKITKAVGLFDKALGGHIAFSLSNIVRAPFHNKTFGWFAPSPKNAGYMAKWYKQLYRQAQNFALVADLTVSLLGGGLKRKQRISGRLADVLSELYFMSAVLKRFDDDGRPADDIKIVELCLRESLHQIQQNLDDVIRNFPKPVVGFVLRLLVFPFGRHAKPVSDKLAHDVVAQALEPGAFRDRLTAGVYVNDNPDDITGRLEDALRKVIAAEAAEKKLHKAVRAGKIEKLHDRDWISLAEKENIIDSAEAELLRVAEIATNNVIAVDDFDADELTKGWK